MIKTVCHPRLAVALLLLSTACLAEAGQAEATQDTISIISVKPDGPVPAGVPVTFTFELEVTLRSAEEADVSVGFNADDVSASKMGTRHPVKAGTQRLRVSASVAPIDRGRVIAFGALIILAPKPQGEAFRFKPLATAFHPVAVIADAPAPRPSGTGDFLAAGPALRRAILDQIAIGRSDLGVEDVIQIIRIAAQDKDSSVRVEAMKAVGGRALASIYARYRPRKGAPADPLGQREPAPVSWISDDERLGYMLWETLAPLAHSDPDDQVRLEALRTMAIFGRIDSVTPYTDQFVELALDAFRKDPSGDVRAEVVQLFDHGPNDTPDIRLVLKLAFLDEDAEVRQMALRTLQPRVIEGPRLSYADVGDMLIGRLQHPLADYRYDAIRALQVLGASAKPALPHLDRLSDRDPDDDVRQRASRAAASIRAAR